jgi:hypothetical protein
MLSLLDSSYLLHRLLKLLIYKLLCINVIIVNLCILLKYLKFRQVHITSETKSCLLGDEFECHPVRNEKWLDFLGWPVSLKGQFHEIFWYTFVFINQLHLGPWLADVKLFPYGFTFVVILTLYFFSALYPTTQIKTKFLKYLRLKNIFCTLLLEVLLMYVYLSIVFL